MRMQILFCMAHFIQRLDSGAHGNVISKSDLRSFRNGKGIAVY